ncbi:MAG: rod shape-determining protein [Nitrospirae bacterium]|nr:rod shape-determining protein [Nitrospirota bacterium]
MLFGDLENLFWYWTFWWIFVVAGAGFGLYLFRKLEDKDSKYDSRMIFLLISVVVIFMLVMLEWPFLMDGEVTGKEIWALFFSLFAAATGGLLYLKATSIGKIFTFKNKNDSYIQLNPQKEFFTERLLKIGIVENSTQISLTDSNNSTYALPLTLKFFDFFKTDSFKKLGEENDGDIGIGFSKDRNAKTVVITIQDFNGDRIRIERHYPEDKIIKKKPDELLLELWPNFTAKGWNKYYVITSKATDVEIVPYAEEDDIHNYEINNYKAYEIKKYKMIFECKYLERKLKNEFLPAGVLLPKLTDINKDGGNWSVAVDFGTSNTIAAYHTGQNEKIFSFKEETACSLQLLKMGSFNRSNVLEEKFFSWQTKTINHFFIYTQVYPYGNGKNIIKDGVIYFPNPTMRDGDPNFRIEGELKWQSRDSETARENIKRVRIFLYQILMIISANARKEGVTKIQLIWTYPSAYTTYMKSQILQYNWNEIINDIGSQTGIKIEEQNAITESEAVCKYMTVRGASPSADTPCIILDIGGGTTDIGIWRGNELVIQTSVRLAGNILADMITKNTGFRDGFFKTIEYKGSSQNNYERNLLERPAFYLNFIFSNPQQYDVNFDNFTLGRSILCLSLSSLFYYVGFLLSTVKTKSDIVRIYLGGNGTKLFDLVWKFNWGNENITNPLIECLQGIFLDAIDNRGNTQNGVRQVSINFPKKEYIKEEVVKGMLKNTVKFGNLAKPTLIAGENGFRANGKDISSKYDLFDTFETMDSINSGAIFNLNGENNTIRQFVYCYNKAAGHRKDLNLYVINKIKTEDVYYKEIADSVIQNVIIPELGKPKDYRIFEPLFISEVKQLCLREDTFSHT